jgi:hypothetical protein
MDSYEHKDQLAETQFVDLLDKQLQIDRNVVPLSTVLLERIYALKVAGDKAEKRKLELNSLSIDNTRT